MKPPSQIDGADVLEWAWSDVPFGTVGIQGDPAPGTPIHGLAICKYAKSETIYRFSCDANWETEQDADHDSIEQAKEWLPQQYRNAPIVWRSLA